MTTPVFGGLEPVAVSPGDPAKLVLIADTCPTFSWGEIDGARHYELVVYRLGEEGEEAVPVLRQRISGSALGWTPSLDHCLERGGRYAWSLRAASGAEESEWSAPSLFQVAAAPSQAEFETALQVVRSYLDVGTGAVSQSGLADEGQATSDSELDVSASAPTPAAPATTQLSVEGGVVAASFTGDGSTLTDLDPANLAAGTATIDIKGKAANVTDTVEISHGGTGATTAATACWNLGAATVANLSAHASGSSHDARYYTEAELQGVGSAQVHWGNLTSLPTTTKGDLLIEDGADVVRLGVGSDGQVLVADSGAPEGVNWMSVAIPCPDSPALVPKTGQTISYDNEDDGDLEKGVPWPNPRFTDNSDGTVTDNLTGLIWLKNADCFGLRSLANALSDALGLQDTGTPETTDDCGLSDGSIPGHWRLPNLRELQSLAHYGVSNPSVPDTAGTGKWSEGDPFSGVASSNYWSSTILTYDATNAYVVKLSYGVVFLDLRGNQYYVWPVRGGQ